MKNKFQLTLGLCLSLFAVDSVALGIDKLAADLDAGLNFKGVASFTVFNDGGENLSYVMAEGLTWQMSETGDLLTAPTEALKIFPSVTRIPAGGSATFKVRYTGVPPSGEGAYRILFKEIAVPSPASGAKEAELANLITSASSVSMAITVPVYVSDFSKKSDVLNQVSATFTQQDNAARLSLDNGGDRHITILDYRINGTESAKGLGVVLAHLKRSFPLDTTDPVTSVEVKISYKDQTKWLSAVASQ